MPSNLAVLRGGQILVWDYRLMRLSCFDEAGELVEASRLELAVPTGADIEQLSEDRVGLMPGSTQLAGEHYDRLLLLGADLKPLSSFLAPCTGRVAALEEAYGMGQCNRILARGIGETVLIGESFTYSVRRYNLTGDLLWDSGQLDPEFTEPASRISSRGEGQSPLVLIHAHNGLSRLLEVPDRGFVIGGWFSQARQGAGTTTSPVGFLDFRLPDGQLLLRTDFEPDYVVGDITSDSDSLYVLVYSRGINDLPDIDIFTCRIDALSW